MNLYDLNFLHSVKPSEEILLTLLNVEGEEQLELFKAADEYNVEKKVYIRGVIELSNICNNNCSYCAMAKGNNLAKRYYMSLDEIKDTIDVGYSLGIRVFHLSSGENSVYTDSDIYEMVKYIYNKNGKAILVMGKKSIKLLKQLVSEFSDITYISKFETSNSWLYNEYNNKNSGLEFRLDFLKKLRDLGIKIGTGNIVGLPFQRDIDLIRDLLLITDINPKQASTSCFIVNPYSRYSQYSCGDVNKTLNFISILRLMTGNNTLIPTNSSLGNFKWNALRCGANLVSINLTPSKYYRNYVIYDELKRSKISLESTIKEIEKTNKTYEFYF